MKLFVYFLLSSSFWAVFLSPPTTDAQLTGEVIFRHTEEANELWITHVEAPHTQRRIFKNINSIYGLSVQKNGNFLVFIADGIGKATDVKLLDRMQRRPEARNLAHLQFELVSDVSISSQGDVAITNMSTEPPEERGLFLIEKKELKHWQPEVKRLKRGNFFSLDWSPDGTQIAYENNNGIFLFHLLTGKTDRIRFRSDRREYFPTFSPNGKYIAFIRRKQNVADQIGVLSLATSQIVKTIEPEDHIRINGFNWSPDGEYLVYTTPGDARGLYHHWGVPLAGGAHEKVLDSQDTVHSLFDWTHTAYAVDPVNRLTTLWGQLKAHDGNR